MVRMVKGLQHWIFLENGLFASERILTFRFQSHHSSLTWLCVCVCVCVEVGGSQGILVTVVAAAAAKSPQSCPTLCDPIDGSPPGSPVPGILQTKILEWVAISFSNVWKWKVKVKSLSRVRLFTMPWTAAYQAPLSMGFSKQEYWSGVPSPWGKKFLYCACFGCMTCSSVVFRKQQSILVETG